jgi:penicillin G amidase
MAVQGRTAEFFGEKTVGVDKFMRTMGFYERAVDSLPLVDPNDLVGLHAYCDGINDYIKNVDFVTAFWNTASAKLLPPEFYIFGMTGEKLEPFTPADIFGFGRLISFHLSWNWNQDLSRESLRQGHPDIADIAEELIPFHADFLHAF